MNIKEIWDSAYIDGSQKLISPKNDYKNMHELITHSLLIGQKISEGVQNQEL